MREFCSYWDATYMDRGLALHDSMQRHCQPYRLWILALCDESYHELVRHNLSNVLIMPLCAIENDKLREAKQNRTWIEYIWTLTASWMLRLFDGWVDELSYIDADCYFFDSPEPVFAEIGNADISITPHRFPPRLKHFESNGLYNVGLVYMRRTDDAMACLREWARQTIEWCYRRNEPGRFADQKYLDAWPEKWGAHSIKHLGANLAPWNQEQYEYRMSGDRMMVNEYPLIWYHFHGRLQPAYPIVPFVREHIYKAYADALSIYDV